MTERPTLGPTLLATIVTPCLEDSISAWCDHLHQHVFDPARVFEFHSLQPDNPSLAGSRRAVLANELDEPWLELIELPGAQIADPFQHSGWFSLEIVVEDVDALYRELEGSPFKMIGLPADLDFSDAIRAMQVIGPAGEVLYLTQIKKPVPPFDLPVARCTVDRLFIPVLLTSNRENTVLQFESLSGETGVKFDTKITVLNTARGFERDHRHPVATIQLKGSNLIEMDELESLTPKPENIAGLPTGIAAVSFATSAIPNNLEKQTVQQGLFKGCKSALMTGSAGELIELIETT